MSVIEPRVWALTPALGEARWRATVGAVDVCFGVGERARLPSIVSELGARRPLIITDPGVRATGIVDELGAALIQLGCPCAVFDGVEENPSTACVEAGVEAARRHDVDLLIGFGGGSSMDTAKGVNFLYTNGGRHGGLRGNRKGAYGDVAVDRRADHRGNRQRSAIVRADLAGSTTIGRWRVAIRGPVSELAFSILESPGRYLATYGSPTGIDAVSHAVESLVSSRANPISRLYSREAWRLLSAAFEAAVTTPDDLEARGHMLLGAHLAGAAIERSMLGAAHACANPLTARFGITHGIAVGVMLPYVVRYNMACDDAATEYDVLEVSDLPGRLAAMLGSAGAAPRLRAHAVPQASLGELAAEAAQQWTATFNPRPVDANELLSIYESAY